MAFRFDFATDGLEDANGNASFQDVIETRASRAGTTYGARESNTSEAVDDLTKDQCVEITLDELVSNRYFACPPLGLRPPPRLTVTFAYVSTRLDLHPSSCDIIYTT